jgi:AcrR family transcriptional regulator
MKTDRSALRTDKTRRKLLGAFTDLVLSRHYESITVRDIVAAAQVSRSTFYEHFSGKDNLLASSLSGLFGVLADTVVRDDPSRLKSALDHFQANGALARELLNGAACHKVSEVLIRQIGIRLRAHGRKAPGRLLLPARLAAAQLAGMILATVGNWVTGGARCDSATLALALRRACGAALGAMYVRAR